MIITTKEVNEEIEMIQLLKTSAAGCAYVPNEGKSTIIKGITLDSFLFVMDKAIAMLKEF